MNRFAAKKMERIKQSGIRWVAEKARNLEASGREVIHLEIGRTDFDTPAPIKEAAKKALDKGLVHYTPTFGHLELRKAISEKLLRENKIEANPKNEILVTAGGTEAIMITLMTVLEPGDEIIIPEPMYLFYMDWGEFLGAKTVPLPLSSEDCYQISRERLEGSLTERTKAIIINSPHNPTGSVLELSSLQAVAEVAQERDLLVISDEVYGKIIYEPFQHVSIASLPGMKERTITIDSFSKSHAMDGWRVGYLAGPAELLWEIDKAHQHTLLSPTTFAQMGALEALKLGDEIVRPMVEEYGARRNLLMKILNSVPQFSYCPPRGTFYVLFNPGLQKMDEWAFSEHLLEKAGVAITPGGAFGPSAKGFIRISYSNTQENIRRGMERLIQTVSALE